MADTVRTMQELNEVIFRDPEPGQTEGHVGTQAIRDLMFSQMVYCEIGAINKPQIALVAGFNKLNLDQDGEVGRNFVRDTDNNEIEQTPIQLKAMVLFEVHFNGASNTTYTFAVFKNGVQVQRLTVPERIVNAAQTGKAAAGASLQLQANDVLDLRVSGGTAVFTLLRGRLFVQRIAVE